MSVPGPNGGTENDPGDDVFYVQVGNPYQWHNTYWGAPETAPEDDPNLSRVALAASASKPAGDIAGETTAALASASMVLRAEVSTDYNAGLSSVLADTIIDWRDEW